MHLLDQLTPRQKAQAFTSLCAALPVPCKRLNAEPTPLEFYADLVTRGADLGGPNWWASIPLSEALRPALHPERQLDFEALVVALGGDERLANATARLAGSRPITTPRGVVWSSAQWGVNFLAPFVELPENFNLPKGL